MPARRQANVGLLRAAAIFVVLPLILTIPLPASAAAAVTVETAANEIIGLTTRTGSTLQTRVLRPPGPGPFALAIISHGSPPDASQRPGMEVPTFSSVSNWLLARGYMVALPLRRGYGQTGGPWLENFGPCSSPDYYRAGLNTAEDIRTAVDYFRVRPEVQRDRILLIGWSAGGWGSLAVASQNPAGVFAVINFAGGRGGGNPQAGNCAPRRLVEAAARFGATARIPTLWLYAANDSFFAPDLARKMSNAFVRGGGRAEYVALPAFGSDGHRVFAAAEGRALWQRPVENFLETLKH
jgi:dienelactone hydrolase